MNAKFIVSVKKTVKIFLSMFLISACSGQMPTLRAATEIPDTNAPTPTPAKSSTPTQVSTLQPNQISLTSTIEALNNDCNTISHEFSPDKRWIAIKCDNGKINTSDELSTILKVVNLETLQEWIVSYYQIYGAKEIETVGSTSDGTVFPINWSADGVHLYIGIMPEVYREYYYSRTAALFVLNLETGGIEEILDEGTVQKTFYDFSLSHNETKIASMNLLGKPFELKITTLSTGQFQSRQLNPKFTSAGSVVWSQDDNRLIFLAVNFSDNSTLSTLYEWNDQTGELVELFQLPDMLGRLFFIVKWDEKNNVVVLKNYHAEEFFKLDLSTGEITPESQ